MKRDYKKFIFKKLNPFKWFVLENFPFIEEDFDAITNWQLFCKLGEYMNKVICKLNELGEQTEDLISAFIELQNYINEYFENLDIQEEINNKLDEMAEDGTLAEIISIYLNSNAIRGFDNIEDMKDAQNVTVGTFAKTFGKDILNDGYGAFYVIREIKNTDVIDNDNIVAINNFPTLVAEKIIDNNLKDIEEKIYSKIEDFVLYAFFDDSNDDVINFFVSKDNLHLKQLKTTNKIYGRDPSIIYYNNKFYVAVTGYGNNYDFVIYESDDLENWTRHEINCNLYDENFQKRWAPDFFIDDNNELYVFISKQYADTEGWGNFNIYKTKCTDIENLIFENATIINLTGTSSTNHIDATCIKIDGIYHLIVKDENQTGLTLEHYISGDLQNFSLQNYDFCDFGHLVEGTFVYKFKNEYIIGVEKYAENNYHVSSYRIKKSSDFVNFSNYRNMYVKDIDISHGSAFVIDNINAKNIISKINGFNFNYDYTFDINKKENYMSAFTTKNSEYPKGRYLKLFSVKPNFNYKSASILFNIFDGQRMFFNSNIQLLTRILTVEPFNSALCRNIQTYANIENYDNFKYNNLHGKILSFPNSNDKCFDVYLDLDTFDIDITVMLKFISINDFDDYITVYTDEYVDTLPITIPTSINTAYKTKSSYPLLYTTNIDNRTSNNVRIKICMQNASFKVEGHGNGTGENNTIDYQVNVLNGNINAINKAINSTINLGFSVVDYTNNIYTIEITNIPSYSGFNIILPNNNQSSILDCKIY